MRPCMQASAEKKRNLPLCRRCLHRTDQDHRGGLACAGIDRLADVRETQPGGDEEAYPRGERSEIPRRRVCELRSEARPRPFPPSIGVWHRTIGNVRMQRLDDDRTPGVQEKGYCFHHVIHRFLPYEGEVCHDSIYDDVECAGRNLLIRRGEKLATTAGSRFFYQAGNRIDACHPRPGFGQAAREPAFTAPQVEDRSRPEARHDSDDRIIRREVAAFYLSLADGVGPRTDISGPAPKYLFVASPIVPVSQRAPGRR